MVWVNSSHSLPDGRLGCFCIVLAHNAAVNIPLPVSFWQVEVLLECEPRNGIAESDNVRWCCIFSKVVVPIYTVAHTAYTSSLLLQPQKRSITLSVWWVKWCRWLLMGFQYLVIGCGPLLFPILWNVFKVLCPFFYWFVFFLLIDRNSWYLLPVDDSYFIPWWCFSWMKDLNYNE